MVGEKGELGSRDRCPSCGEALYASVLKQTVRCLRGHLFTYADLWSMDQPVIWTGKASPVLVSSLYRWTWKAVDQDGQTLAEETGLLEEVTDLAATFIGTKIAAGYVSEWSTSDTAGTVRLGRRRDGHQILCTLAPVLS